MSGESISLMDGVGASEGREAYALTDEQILGMEGEEAIVPSTEELRASSHGRSTAAATAAASARDDKSFAQSGRSKPEDSLEAAQARVPFEAQGRPVPQEPPKWLAREMNDPWIGDEARELWENAQRAQQEAAAYREVIGTPEDARTLREIYPGGVAEARSAAERARELAEIDAAIFGSPGRGAQELRAGRAQLVERLYAQDPGALRELVEAGMRLLGEDRLQSATVPSVPQDAAVVPRSLHSVAGAPNFGAEERTGHFGRDDKGQTGAHAETSRDAAAVPVPQVVSAYREFERATNAELERSVGGAIGRALDAVLPNLKWSQSSGNTGGPRSGGLLADRGKQAASLQERLQAGVKEEVEAALRSDAGLGEQVARVLSGKRFDEAARAQVVRLIDARARQLVPGAVKKVVGSWTAATLGTKSPDARVEPDKSIATHRSAAETRKQQDNRDNSRDSGRRASRGRVDYRKWSDEQILEM